MARKRLGLLDNDDADIAVDTLSTETITAQCGIAQALIDISDGEKEGNILSRNSDDLIEVHAALEELTAELRVAQELGGLPMNTARFVKGYSACLLSRVGYKQHAVIIPSLESFDRYSTRYTSTVTSVQNINLALEGIWKDLKKMLDEFIKWMRKQWLKLFSGAEQLKHHAEAVKKRAENNEFQGGSLDGDEASKILKKIIYKGGAKRSDISVIESAVRALPGRWSDFVYNVSGKIENVVSSVTSKKDTGKDVEEIMKILEAEKTKISSAGEPMQRKDGEPMAEGESINHQVLPGNMVIELLIEQNLEKCKLKLKGGRDEGGKAGSLRPLDKINVISLCDDIIAISEILIEFRKKSNKLDKAADKLEQAGQKLSNFNPPEVKAGAEDYFLGFEAAEPDVVDPEAKHKATTAKAEEALGAKPDKKPKADDGKKNSKDYKSIGKFVNSFGLDLLKLPMDIYSHSVKTCYGYLDWCVESITAGS